MSEVMKAQSGEGLRRFKPYPVYKDSSVEWLGEIPAHWEVRRIGDCAPLINGFPFDSQYFVRSVGVPLLRIRDLYRAETEVNYIGPIVQGAWIETGEIIVGMDGDFNVARWQGPRALLNQRMCCLRPLPDNDAAFIAYLLPLPLKVTNDLTYSTTVKHLSSDDVRKIRFGWPPLPEQRAIAAFLDRETTNIDALVAKKERLIELLQEKRTALITRAVTKGLDPNVPMKDSGVEWLGEIPAHWEVERLKYLGLLNPQSLDENTDPGFEMVYVDIGGVDSVGRIVEREALTFGSAPTRARRIVRGGDVIVSTVRTYLRAIAVINNNESNLVVSTGFAVVRPNRGLTTDFAAYALRAPYFVERVVANSTGVSYPAINESEMATYALAVPPAPEQRAIAAFLERETTKIDALIAKIREGIQRLKEYRTALISAAVTGKIDVREEVAS